MGRKPVPKISKAVQAMDTAVEKYEEQKLSIQQAEEMYGDGQPYERLRLENEIRFYQQQMGESLIEIGKRLNRIKASEEHGGFLQVLQNINMEARSAQYAMIAARKFGNTKSISYLGDTKVLALTVLDDDSIQALEDGGKAAGVTLDEIERMTVRELKAALRTEREKRKKEKKVQEDAISKKEEKLNELEQKLRYQEPPTKEQLAEIELEKHLKPFNSQLQDAIFAMNRCVEKITEIQRIENIGYVQLNAWILRQSEDIENFTESFTELQDAINDIHIDRDGDEGKEAVTDV